MNSLAIRRAAFLVTWILFNMLIFSACSLPAFGIPRSTPTSQPTISGAMLTEVAATVFAGLPPRATSAPLSAQQLPTQTPTATPKTISPTTAIPPTLAPPPVSSSTPTRTFTPTSTATRKPTVTASPIYPTPTRTLTPLPTATHHIYTGVHFLAENVNIPSCCGPTWIIFALFNNGSVAFESLSLKVEDRDTDVVLYGPLSSNAPFMDSDSVCSSSYIDTLYSGQMLYAGADLGHKYLSDHYVRVSLKLCTGEGLKGTCFHKTVEFTIP